jgi:hypothetical protein
MKLEHYKRNRDGGLAVMEDEEPPATPPPQTDPQPPKPDPDPPSQE